MPLTAPPNLTFIVLPASSTLIMYKSCVKVESVSESKVIFRSSTFRTVGYEGSNVILRVVSSTGETELGLREIDC